MSTIIKFIVWIIWAVTAWLNMPRWMRRRIAKKIDLPVPPIFPPGSEKRQPIRDAIKRWRNR